MSVITAHGVSPIKSLAVMLSSFHLPSMLSVKLYEGDNASSPLFTPTLTCFLSTDQPTHPVLVIVYSEMTSDPTMPTYRLSSPTVCGLCQWCYHGGSCPNVMQNCCSSGSHIVYMCFCGERLWEVLCMPAYTCTCGFFPSPIALSRKENVFFSCVRVSVTWRFMLCCGLCHHGVV